MNEIDSSKLEDNENKKIEDKKEQEKSRQEKQKKRQKRILISSLILVALLCVLCVLLVFTVRSIVGSSASGGSASGQVEKTTVTPTTAPTAVPTDTPTVTPTATPIPTATPTPTPVTALTGDMLVSDYAYMIRVSDQSVILDKNADARAYPASVTKIMTALVAIEHIPDLNTQITLSQEMIDRLYLQEASMAGFSGGEAPTAMDLLYGTMLPSGADACDGLAVAVAGSEEAFVELMNQKAAELGMTNTHFVTCSGLHDENHYTTSKDMAVLLLYALKNDTFRTVFTAKTYTSTPNTYHPEGIYMESTLFSKVESTTLTNGGELLGGKTGYTDEAGLCLASLATVHDEEYILVTMHAQGNHYTEQFHIQDAFTAYNALK